MLQHDFEFRGVAEVAPAACRHDVVAYHRANCLSSFGLMHDAARKPTGDCLRQMLVLGDRVDLFKCEVAQRDTVFQRERGKTSFDP